MGLDFDISNRVKNRKATGSQANGAAARVGAGLTGYSLSPGTGKPDS